MAYRPQFRTDKDNADAGRAMPALDIISKAPDVVWRLTGVEFNADL